jgi:multidrug efflux system membrane fusion protein
MKTGMNQSVVLPVIFVGVTALLAGGCSGKKKTGPPPGAPVTVAQAVATNVPVRIDPPPVGHVTPVSTVTVHSQIGGLISAVHFKEGSEVKSNELLFTIDPRPTQAALDQARANLERDAGQLEYQKVNYARDQKLFAAKIISQDQLDTDKASLDAAIGTTSADRAAITNAMLNLEFCEIRAPFDGVTGSLLFHEGNVVKAPDDVLLTINMIHPIYVEFAVPEQYLPEIKKQMQDATLKVSVTFENMTAPPPQGDLTFVDNSVDETTGTILLKATFPNEDGALWPGQFVQVALTLSELTDAVVVPSQAVQVGQNGQFIYVVKTDPTNTAAQTVELRTVKTGITFNNETVIENGLQAGETVVTDGQLRLAPKMKVTVKVSGNPATNAPAN